MSLASASAVTVGLNIQLKTVLDVTRTRPDVTRTGTRTWLAPRTAF